MSELSIDISISAPEGVSGECHFPSDLDLGTGSYLAFLAAGALKSPEPVDIAREMVDRGAFVLSATLQPNRNLTVLLGILEPTTEKTFVVPPYIDEASPHAVQINFADWKITSATLGEQRLGISLSGPRPSQGSDDDFHFPGSFG